MGKIVTVRQDGRGDYKEIQAAINAVPANSLIEIRDNGPYYELIRIPADKPGLTLRGSGGAWPFMPPSGSSRWR